MLSRSLPLFDMTDFCWTMGVAVISNSSAVFPLLFNNSIVVRKTLIMLEEIDWKIQHNSDEKYKVRDNSGEQRGTRVALDSITSAGCPPGLYLPA